MSTHATRLRKAHAKAIAGKVLRPRELSPPALHRSTEFDSDPDVAPLSAAKRPEGLTVNEFLDRPYGLRSIAKEYKLHQTVLIDLGLLMPFRGTSWTR